MRKIRTFRFGCAGCGKDEAWRGSRAPQTKVSGRQRIGSTNHRATPRSHTSGLPDIGVQNRNLGGSVIAAGDCFVLRLLFSLRSISSSTRFGRFRVHEASIRTVRPDLCPVTALELGLLAFVLHSRVEHRSRLCDPMLTIAAFAPSWLGVQFVRDRSFGHPAGGRVKKPNRSFVKCSDDSEAFLHRCWREERTVTITISGAGLKTRLLRVHRRQCPVMCICPVNPRFVQAKCAFNFPRSEGNGLFRAWDVWRE